MHWIKLALHSGRLDSSTGTLVDQYPEDASANPTQVNIFQLISTVSEYHQHIYSGHDPITGDKFQEGATC